MMAVAACGTPASSTTRANGHAALDTAPIVEIPRANLVAAVARMAESGEGEPVLSPLERRELVSLYAEGGSLWLDEQGRPGEQAREALALLAAAPAHGLDPVDYDLTGLDQLAGNLASPATPMPARTGFEVALSLAMMRFWHDLHLGRVDPRAIGYRIPGPVDEHDFPGMLRAAAADSRVRVATIELVPPLVLYRSVARELARYRVLADTVPPVVFQAPSASIKPGAAFLQAPALRSRLIALGDLPADTTPVEPAIYDGALVSGIQRFQRRHGLEPDGAIGQRTVAALNVPLQARVGQLVLALERLRWLPHLSPGFLAVNIPMFRLWGWDVVPLDGAPAFEMDVIVGRALNTETPVLIERMRYVTFRPYWNVPASITRSEILPALARDPGYLAREDMEIVSGETDEATPVPATGENLERLRLGQLRVRQRPGPKNSLGLVKFSFPNDENIYLHGTPATQLFGRPRRDFSHGCVRVQDPVALAQWVLRDQPEWTRERILAAMSGPRPVRVDLTRPISVILFYLTAVVMPEDGTVHFADDIYGLDAGLSRALAAARPRRAGLVPPAPGAANTERPTREP